MSGGLSDIPEEVTQLSERVVERQLARKSLINFTNYTFPEYDENWHHRLMCNIIDRWVDGVIDRLMVFMPPRHGKQLADDTPVMTLGGWKSHGDLKAGDYVFNQDGDPVKVISVSGKTRSTVKITLFNDGVFFCHPNHEWIVYDRTISEYRKVEAKYFLEETKFGYPRQITCGGRAKFQVPNRAAIQFEQKDLPVEPYALGLWLGDGTAGKACITHARDDTAPIEKMNQLGYDISTECTHKDTGVVTTYFSGQVTNAGRLTRELQKAGVYNDKHIPEIYLRSSLVQRLELLAGLLDSDGHCERGTGRCRFVNVNERLIDGVYDLCNTLGFRPYTTQADAVTSTSGVVGRNDVYTVGFQPHLDIPCALDRKAPQRLKQSRRRIGIKSVESVDEGKQGHCIQVEGGIYLAGESLVPTHNSEIVSRRLPAYILGKYPDDNIIATSYSGSLSNRMNRDTQRIMTSRRYHELFPETILPRSNASSGIGTAGYVRNSTQFEIVNKKGVYYSAGIRGGITGRGADWVIIDDPIKDMEQAMSQTIRDKIWEWYTSTLFSRLESDARILLTMTRWHTDDLAGRLLRQAEENPDADQWVVLSLPALCTDPSMKFERREQVDEPLWSNKKTYEDLKRIRNSTPTKVWSSLFQQNPTPDEGSIWKRSYITPVKRDRIPDALKSVAYDWDLAYTSKETNSASAYIKSGYFNNSVYILDAGHVHKEFPDLIRYMKQKGDRHYIEDAASGKSAQQTLKRNNVDAFLTDVEKDKLARTRDVTPFGESGRIFIAADLYDYLFDHAEQGIIHLSETNDDIDLNDALTQAVSRHLGHAVTDWQKLADDPDLNKGRVKI